MDSKKTINLRPIPDRLPRMFHVADVSEADHVNIGKEISEEEMERLMCSAEWCVRISVN